MKKLTSPLAISLYITFVIFGVCYAWVIGENRIVNSDFEKDVAGQKPNEWALEKGG